MSGNGEGPRVAGADAAGEITATYQPGRQGVLFGEEGDLPVTRAEWIALHHQALAEVGLAQPWEPITMDTLRAAGVPEPEECGLHPNLWGAATSAAASESMIRTDGQTVPSRRRSRHGGRGLRWWVDFRAVAS